MNGTGSGPAPHADPNPLRSRARRRRRVELLAGWVVLVVLVVALVAGGPWLLVIPGLAVAALVLANTVAAATGRGPEEQALTPGRLSRAAPDRDPVAVPATWAPRRHAPDRHRHEGQLRWGDGRLRFTVERAAAGRRTTAASPLSGMCLLDAEPWELRLGPAPTLWRPQLVLHHGADTHVLDLCPGWDLAGVGVGVLLAAEWHHQLEGVGVDTATP
ncbi:hypothetical protein [Rhabdothermincola salaria]|uniref:hypothetical protein n=1 Tax=Rhabdothermincola salaria TaxID=2903142 RepID=UPI001E590B67|nr:hypothetical protein [Rhabdothermincola salaria]MCD9624430.1 hypothetical protein [Rhabdothermincola salaria]